MHAIIICFLLLIFELFAVLQNIGLCVWWLNNQMDGQYVEKRETKENGDVASLNSNRAAATTKIKRYANE